MSLAYLVDTDWVIDHFHGIAAVTRKLEELRPAGLALSVISLAELYEGVHYARDPARSRAVLTRFLEAVSVLPIDETACDIFGRERGRLRRDGRTIGDFDLLIAATCLRHGLTLCSNNRRHFEVVTGLQVLSQT
ncbi:MAG: type II toxin-antitoxin system VapC family toxin [candidate division NC10 bacterium]